VVLCGDAAFTRANLERGEIPGQYPAAGTESLAHIRSLVNDDLGRAFPSHDPTTFRPGTYR
jgi:glyoxylase-like metal-dependent hydrolase (beta-lactamase superfamily II)